MRAQPPGAHGLQHVDALTESYSPSVPSVRCTGLSANRPAPRARFEIALAVQQVARQSVTAVYAFNGKDGSRCSCEPTIPLTVPSERRRLRGTSLAVLVARPPHHFHRRQLRHVPELTFAEER